MNENPKNEPSPYVHPEKASFSFEVAFLGGFLLFGLGTVISAILASWAKVQLDHDLSFHPDDPTYVSSFSAPLSLAKNFAIVIGILAVLCLGAGLFFRFRKKN